MSTSKDSWNDPSAAASIPSPGEILEILRGILVSEFGLEASSIEMGSHLVDDLDLDSMDAVDLAVKIEVKMDFDLKADDLPRLETLGDVVKMIQSDLAES